MLVQWTTKNSASPEVRWGSKPGQYPFKAVASTLTYTKEDLCGPPANVQGWLDPGALHKAVMTDLDAGQRYYYIYGDEVSAKANTVTLVTWQHHVLEPCVADAAVWSIIVWSPTADNA